ncbi:MAG: pantoate--beta-alanine ligase, partial [Planctomycetota bacterium]
KLFNILPASHAFFGRKDYQQLRVIQDMVTDLNVSVEVIGCEIVREQDGLAMSSRNRYLSSAERHRAISLRSSILLAREIYQSGQRDFSVIEREMLQRLKQGLDDQMDQIDYAVIVDHEHLQPISMSNGSECEPIALVAARVGETRLIDNQTLS